MTAFLLKRTNDPDKVISPSELEFGELALNYTTGGLYYKNASGIVKSITVASDTSSNLIIGTNSGSSLTDGVNNILIGDSVGTRLTVGSNNVLIGADPPGTDTSNTLLIAAGGNERLKIDDTGTYFNGILSINYGGLLATNGSFVANSATTISNATTNVISIGFDAGLNAGNYDICIGNLAGYQGAGATGQWNVSIGHRAHYYYALNTSSTLNVSIGNEAGGWATGNSNNCIGSGAGKWSTGSYNNCIGDGAGYNHNGNYNNFIGVSAGRYLTTPYPTGSYNECIGNETGRKLTTGSYNLFLGRTSGYSTTSGDNNVFLGQAAGYQNFTGNQNVCIGNNAGYRNAASGNVFVGAAAAGATSGFGISGGQNVAIGQNAGFWIRSSGNTVVGYSAGYNLTTGQNNAFVGNLSGNLCSTGNDNASLGYNTGPKSAGSRNVCVGQTSGFNLTGSDNTIIGPYAGTLQTTSNNLILIGNNANASTTTVSNEIVIGNDLHTSATIYGKMYLPGGISSVIQTSVDMTTGVNLDLAAGNYFNKTVTGTTTFTISNVPASGKAISFVLDLINGGSATVNWWATIKWPGGTPPTKTVSGRDSFMFYTYDGGTTWTGIVLGLDIK